MLAENPDATAAGPDSDKLPLTPLGTLTLAVLLAKLKLWTEPGTPVMDTALQALALLE